MRDRLLRYFATCCQEKPLSGSLKEVKKRLKTGESRDFYPRICYKNSPEGRLIRTLNRGYCRRCHQLYFGVAKGVHNFRPALARHSIRPGIACRHHPEHPGRINQGSLGAVPAPAGPAEFSEIPIVPESFVYHSRCPPVRSTSFPQNHYFRLGFGLVILTAPPKRGDFISQQPVPFQAVSCSFITITRLFFPSL